MKTITDGSLNIEEWSRPPNICTDSLFVFIHPLLFLKIPPLSSGASRPLWEGGGRGDREEEENDGAMDSEEEDRRRVEERGWRDGVEVTEEGVNAAAAASLSVNGSEEKPAQKELMCVALFKAGVFVCVRW